jgi:hypothetical protein
MFGDASSGNVARGNAAAANERTNAQDTTNALTSGYNIYKGLHG